MFFRIHTCHGKLSKFGTSAQQEIQIINSYSEGDFVCRIDVEGKKKSLNTLYGFSSEGEMFPVSP